MNLKPLEANPRRQAVPALRGYAYQAWHSVYKWITLAENEILFLEGAEDLDVVTGDGATTVQIKETGRSGAVTLNSPDVLEAIAHIWEHQRKNPGRVITMHFITTSKRGCERSNPFGGTAGLDYWDDCKQTGYELPRDAIYYRRRRHSRSAPKDDRAAPGGDRFGQAVLLLYDSKAGHAGGMPMSKIIEDTSLEISFLFWQLGIDQSS